jgi:hypothetical protein
MSGPAFCGLRAGLCVVLLPDSPVASASRDCCRARRCDIEGGASANDGRATVFEFCVLAADVL